jgi:hypothetical protein
MAALFAPTNHAQIHGSRLSARAPTQSSPPPSMAALSASTNRAQIHASRYHILTGCPGRASFSRSHQKKGQKGHRILLARAQPRSRVQARPAGRLSARAPTQSSPSSSSSSSLPLPFLGTTSSGTPHALRTRRRLFPDTLFLPPAVALSNACWWIMVPAGILVAVAAKKLFLLEPCLISYLITKKLWVYVFAPSVFVREFSSNTCFFTKSLSVFTAVFTVRFMLVYPLLRF